MKTKKFIKFSPIYLISVYLLSTVFLHAFGPINYINIHPIRLYSYLLISILLLFIGFYLGANKGDKLIRKSTFHSKIKNGIVGISIKLYPLLLLVLIILLHFTLYARTGNFMYNLKAISNSGDAYYQRYLLVISRDRSYIEWARIILSPLSLMFFPIGIINWKKISIISKLMFAYLIVGNVLVDLTTGTNKGFADVIIYLTIFIYISIIYSSEEFTKVKRAKYFRKKLKKNIKRFSLIFFIFMLVFTINIGSRLQQTSISASKGYLYITSYVTQGYQAVDYSFDQKFESTYGFGSSMYLLRSTPDWFGSDYIENRTYLQKNEESYGWNQRIKWSSIYVWIANDFSIYGALFIIFIIGIFFGRVWIEAIKSKKIFSIILAGQMFMLCLYIPANNQVIQTAEALAGISFWLLFRIQHNYRISINKSY